MRDSAERRLLIAARAAQGLAGALLVPGSLAILAATFEGAARGKAVGTWTAWTGIATVLGPAGGGALIEALSWRAIFWVNVPLIVVTILLTLHSVAESRTPRPTARSTGPGIALSAAGLGGPVFALIQQPTHGWGDPIVFVPLIAGHRCCSRLPRLGVARPHAMLDLTLFRIRNFCGHQPRDADRLRGADRGVLLRHPLPPADDRLHAARGRAWRRRRSRSLLFLLSPRFGKIATGVGPRLPMSVGPIVGGIGLLLLTAGRRRRRLRDRRAAGRAASSASGSRRPSRR